MLIIYPGESPSYLITVEESKGEVIGQLRLYEMEEYQDGAPTGRVKGSIQDVGVRPDRRSQGIARRLMVQAIELARTRNLSCLELSSNAKRQHARALYESLGFEIVSDEFRLLLSEVA